MLKEIIDAWKSKGLLADLFDRFQNMMEETEDMFDAVYRIIYEDKNEDSEKKLFRTDIVVNKAERKVRKKIIEHLAIRPDIDMPACLILMSVVKDTERIGDYCKNLYEAYNISGGFEERDAYRDELHEVHTKIRELFEETRNAILKHSEDLGKDVIIKQTALSKQCDSFIRKVAGDENLKNAHAVGYALISRHYKRIASHLANVASSVVVPVHKIDYYYEKDEDGKHYIK